MSLPRAPVPRPDTSEGTLSFGAWIIFLVTGLGAVSMYSVPLAAASCFVVGTIGCRISLHSLGRQPSKFRRVLTRRCNQRLEAFRQCGGFAKLPVKVTTAVWPLVTDVLQLPAMNMLACTPSTPISLLAVFKLKPASCPHGNVVAAGRDCTGGAQSGRRCSNCPLCRIERQTTAGSVESAFVNRGHNAGIGEGLLIQRCT